MIILRDEYLSRHTTFRIGGPAKLFLEINNEKDLDEALDLIKKNKPKLLILGGGSNILISDEGFKGAVLKINLRGKKIIKSGENIFIEAGAGEIWDDIVAITVENNFGGLENMSLIPGTVGGAVFGNIGAYGREIRDALEWTDAMSIETRKVIRFDNKKCRFGYRDSFFKKHSGEFIILKACFRIRKNHHPDLSYPDLSKYFLNKNSDIKTVRKAVIEIRKTKLVYPDEFGNAGSFFKNPVVPAIFFEDILKSYPHIKGNKVKNGRIKLSAGQLIEEAGLKGKAFRGVGVSEKHALVIVNYGKGKFSDIMGLSNKIKMAVFKKFKVKLESEIKIIDN